MANAKLEWHQFEEGEFEIHVLPHFAHKNVGSDDISNEPYAFNGKVQRAGSDAKYAGTCIWFKSAADVEYGTPDEALNAGLDMGHRIIAGEINGLSVDDLK